MNTTEGFHFVAATFTPFKEDGEVDLSPIGAYAETLVKRGVNGVFVCGTTGEGKSMSTGERKSVAEEWAKASSPNLEVIVHVGHESVKEAAGLASHAEQVGAAGIGCIAPSFFKSATPGPIIEFMAEVARSASDTPFYYYHIPEMTGLAVRAIDFLEALGSRIPSFKGIKYTDPDLYEFDLCRTFDTGECQLFYGRDEQLLGALALSADGAVGSTYNYLSPLYGEMVKRFNEGALVEALGLQHSVNMLVRLFKSYGSYGNACQKALMRKIGLNLGPVRYPLQKAPPEVIGEFLRKVDELQLEPYFFSN